MPYKRRYPATKKRKYSAKRTPSSPWRSIGGAAIGAMSGFALQMLKKRLGLNTEKHWVDAVDSNVATNNTCSTMAYPLTIPVDDTVSGRNGAKVRLTSYTIKGRISSNTAATTGALVRVFVVRAFNTRGTSFTSGNFLDSNTRVTSPYNMGDTTSATGYKVLYDKTFKMAPPGNEGDRQTFEFSYKPLNHHLEWVSTDTTGVDTNLVNGFIRGYIMTDETTANTPNFWANHRVKFVDN